MAGIRFDAAEAIVKIGIIKASGNKPNKGVDNGNQLGELGIVDEPTLDALREEIVQGTFAYHYRIEPAVLNLTTGLKVYEVIDQVIDNAIRL